MSTLVSFTTALASLDITGVTTEYANPPLSLNTADLPAQWIQVPTITDEVSRTFDKHGQLWGMFTAQLVVAYEPVGQNMQSANWSNTMTMMDNVWTALAGSGETFVKGRVTYIIRQAMVTVAGIDYWAVVAEVTGHG